VQNKSPAQRANNSKRRAASRSHNHHSIPELPDPEDSPEVPEAELPDAEESPDPMSLGPESAEPEEEADVPESPPEPESPEPESPEPEAPEPELLLPNRDHKNSWPQDKYSTVPINSIQSIKFIR